MNRDGFQQQQPSAGAGLLPTIPAMPSVSADSVYQGRPLLLLEEGLRHSIGWQAGRKAGPGFVVVRLRRVDAVHVVERFLLTEQGWEDAWRALSDLDPAAAAAVAAKLSRDDARRLQSPSWTRSPCVRCRESPSTADLATRRWPRARYMTCGSWRTG